MSLSSGYSRCLLKLSGEALGGDRGYGMDREAIDWIAGQIAGPYHEGRQIGIVVGGGNILRGADSASIGVPGLVGDHMGMISTVLNAIALRWALSVKEVQAKVMCAFNVSNFVELFDGEKARDYLAQGNVVIFAGGTGNPCFTTDSAAALRAVEIDADVVIKATQAAGVYDKDPNKFQDAELFEIITPQEVLQRQLGVMDASAIEILGRKNIPTIVLDLHVDGNVAKALSGAKIGTLVAWT
jgi:uridylate kinase